MSDVKVGLDTLLIGLLVFLAGGGLATISLWRTRGRPVVTDVDRFKEAPAEARRERDAQVALLQARVNELQAVVNTLASQLAEARRTIESLQERQHQVELERATTGRRPASLRPLLVVEGDDVEIAQQDEALLDGIGVRYIRLRGATREAIGDEVRRAEEDGQRYRWGVVSAHAGEPGVRLIDGMAEPLFWARNFGGFEAVLLASCSSTNVADALREKCDFVAYFKEDVPKDKAPFFVKCFVQRLNAGDSQEQAFTSACDANPEVAPYAAFRKGARKRAGTLV